MADDRELEARPSNDEGQKKVKRPVRKLMKSDLAVAISGLMLGCCTQGCCEHPD
ncbi:MAG TPA: hypothetical protein VGH20_14895 [Myxococcales bacterium]|jgi:hypothetical protein